MDAELIHLMDLLIPPERPVFANGDWSELERTLGIRLPPDYKNFISTYGSGSFFGKSFIISNYLNENPESVVENVGIVLSEFEIIATSGFNVPFPLYPAKGGLLPWGGSNYGDYFMWQTTGEPNEWDVVLSSSYCREFERFSGVRMVEFLIDLLTGRVPEFQELCCS